MRSPHHLSSWLVPLLPLLLVLLSTSPRFHVCHGFIPKAAVHPFRHRTRSALCLPGSIGATGTCTTTPSSSSLQSTTETQDEVATTTITTSSADDEDSADANAPSSKKEIVASARITLPFSASTAFDAFSDLPRQPSWSPWLRDVAYLDTIMDDDDGASISISSDGTPLRETRWTMGYRGFSFSWNAVSTRLERPTVIEWESTSGLRNYGSVRFEERSVRASSFSVDIDSNEEEETMAAVETEMLLSMRFRAPRVIAALFRRSSKIRHVMEEMLEGTLQGFKSVVMQEDLGLVPPPPPPPIAALEAEVEADAEDQR